MEMCQTRMCDSKLTYQCIIDIKVTSLFKKLFMLKLFCHSINNFYFKTIIRTFLLFVTIKLIR